MKYIITLSALIIFFFTNSIAEESPPKVTTQQFDNWTYQCVENNKNKNCEVSQTIRIQNTNINFSIAYTKFLNDKQKKIAEKIIKKVDEKLLGKVVTTSSLLHNYCPAEEYHQRFLEKR